MRDTCHQRETQCTCGCCCRRLSSRSAGYEVCYFPAGSVRPNGLSQGPRSTTSPYCTASGTSQALSHSKVMLRLSKNTMMLLLLLAANPKNEIAAPQCTVVQYTAYIEDTFYIWYLYSSNVTFMPYYVTNYILH